MRRREPPRHPVFDLVLESGMDRANVSRATTHYKAAGFLA
jgi:hypothetical protein